MSGQGGARVLFYNVYWLDSGGEPVGPGYIYLRGGVVEAVEPGEPPEERQFAEMVVGGESRLVVPGLLLGPVVPETYALRWLAPPARAADLLAGAGEAAEAVASMSGVEAYYSSLMMFYEAAVEGYTAVIALSPHPAEAARALEASGLWGLVLVPRGCGSLDYRGEPPRIGGEGRVSYAILDCDSGRGGAEGLPVYRLAEGGVIEAPSGEAMEAPPWRGRGLPAPVTASAASPWPLLSGLSHPSPRRAYEWMAWRGYRALPGMEGYEPLSGRANLALIDLSEPPGWQPSPGPVEALGPSRPRVETLVSQGRIVVDGGEHLYLGSSAAGEAAEKLRPLLERLGATGAGPKTGRG